MKIKIGDKAPAFSPDAKGVWSLLYFYPKDDTPGCTKEACTLRDAYPKFKKLGVRVFGVSTDSSVSHDKFIKKFDLPFTLIPDENKELVRAYGVWGKKKFMGREYMGTNRSSFLIDPKGKIVKIYEDVKPEKHAEEVLKDLKTLMS